MKRKILFAFALTAAFATSAQQESFVEMPKEIVADFAIEVPNSSSNSVAAPVPFWTNTFDTPSDWVLDNNGQTAPNGWSIDATADGWWSSNGITSTSGGNFAELTNGDPTQGTQALNVTYTMTIASSIDVMSLAGTDAVLLTYEEYGARFNDLQEVQISTDNVTYTTVADNLAYSVLSQSGGAAYPNPALRSVNIQPYISGNASTVWIRFSWTTNYPNSATNPNVWVAYGWYIDDVSLVGVPDNVLGINDEVIGGWWVGYQTAGGLGQDYTFNPMAQATANPYAFEAVVANEGLASQNITMYADVVEDATGSSVYSGSSNAITLAYNEQDTFVTNTAFTPSNSGLYTIDMWAVGDSANTDTTTKMTIVTDYVYGKDFNNQTGGWRFARSNGALEIAADYDIYADADLYSVDAFITDYSVVGTPVFVVLYEIDGTNSPIWLAQSDDYFLTASDIDNWVNIPFSSSEFLTSGTTFSIAIGGYASASDTAGVGVSGSGVASVDRMLDKDDIYGNGANTWYSISDIPMLRMNFNSTVSTTSAIESSNVNIYPNPSNGVFTLEVDVADYTVVVSNVLGQPVYTSKVSELSSTIDLSLFATGVYTIELTNNKGTITEKVILK